MKLLRFMLKFNLLILRRVAVQVVTTIETLFSQYVQKLKGMLFIVYFPQFQYIAELNYVSVFNC